jgi:PKD repeat protein
MPAVLGVWGRHVWADTVWGAHVWAGSVLEPPVAMFSITGSGFERTFDSTESFDPADNAITRAWNFGDGQIAGDVVAPTHTYIVAGTYVVVLTVTNRGGLVDTFTTEVTIAAVCDVSTITVTTGTVSPSEGIGSTRICNMALAHCGIGKMILSLEERSKEARACNLFYAPVRDEILGDFPWPFATRVELLALVETDPTVEWRYGYRYPIDALVVRRIQNGVSRLDTPSSRVIYHVGSDAIGNLLYTDQPDAYIEYTAKSTDPTLYPPDFVFAFSLKLAAAIAPQLMSDGGTRARIELLQMYELEIGRAHARAANEHQRDYPPDSEFITVRD